MTTHRILRIKCEPGKVTGKTWKKTSAPTGNRTLAALMQREHPNHFPTAPGDSGGGRGRVYPCSLVADKIAGTSSPLISL